MLQVKRIDAELPYTFEKLWNQAVERENFFRETKPTTANLSEEKGEVPGNSASASLAAGVNQSGMQNQHGSSAASAAASSVGAVDQSRPSSKQGTNISNVSLDKKRKHSSAANSGSSAAAGPKVSVTSHGELTAIIVESNRVAKTSSSTDGSDNAGEDGSDKLDTSSKVCLPKKMKLTSVGKSGTPAAAGSAVAVNQSKAPPHKPRKMPSGDFKAIFKEVNHPEKTGGSDKDDDDGEDGTSHDEFTEKAEDEEKESESSEEDEEYDEDDEGE